MKRIAVLGNGSRPGVRKVVAAILPWLEGRARVVKVDLNTEPSIQKLKADLALVFGGDGTLLSVARSLNGNRVPLLGINMGKLGFLTELTVETMKSALDKAFQSDLCVEEFMMLDCDVVRTGAKREKFIAVNDAVVTRRTVARPIGMDLYFDNSYVATYSGDGLIVSTPVGSTAHSLSAGGPIVNPSLHAFVITPICPHTLSNRTLVIPAETVVRIDSFQTHMDAILTLDGQIFVKIKKRDKIEVRRSKKSVFLARAGKWNYYHTLKDKFHWGGHPDYGESKRKNNNS